MSINTGKEMQNKTINNGGSFMKKRRAMNQEDAHRHSAGCAHDHKQGKTVRGKLLAVFALTAFYTFAEAVGGWLTGSLALLADAGHMAVDALALGLALAASRLAARPATEHKTFGYFRFETLAAFVNAAALLLISASILYEAAGRLLYPATVESGGMMVIAFGGLMINLLSIRILHGHHDHDLNSRGAWLHLVGDTLGSVGAVLAGAFIYAFGWNRADPAVGILIAVFIVYNSWALLRRAAHVLLEGAPAHLSLSELRQAFLGTEGVEEIHDLHIWEIATGRAALSCHVVHPESFAPQKLLALLQERIRRDFGIEHLTLQLEQAGDLEKIYEFCRSAGRGCFGSGTVSAGDSEIGKAARQGM